LKLAEAKRWIEHHYGNQTRYQKTKSSPPSDDEYIQALRHIDHIRFVTNSEKKTRELFLYDGCLRFGRWFVPSPPSVPFSHKENFRRCAHLLQQVEHVPMNAPVFIVHTIRNDLYTEFADLPLPLGQVEITHLKKLSSCLDEVPVPNNEVKRDEFTKAIKEVKEIIVGLEDGTLRSYLRTTMPYPIARRPVQFTFNWGKVPIKGTITSTFLTPSELLCQAAPPLVLAPRTPTRWQYGKSLVELEFSALIDASIQVPALQLPSMELPFDTWPNGLQLAYEILYQACWELRRYSEFISIWVPSPGDIGDIESWVSSSDNVNINYIRRGHPSMLLNGFVPTKEALSVEFGNVGPALWHDRCRVLAEQYARFGETREALFWLNVGVEALLKERMEAHIFKVGAKVDLDILDGSDTYWDQAKELIAKKFPDLTDEIEWPRNNQKPSRFRQLKYFCRTVVGAPDLHTTQANYSKVSKKRNSLFHGESEEPISVKDVKVAMEGFDWLDTEFCA
jgi:hypothetical protein